MLFAGGVGALRIFRLSSRLFFNCLTYWFRFKQNLLAKYGTKGKTYAVVTGGTDGIGLDLCDQLAEQGFNICIISRNKSKIDAKLLEIKTKYPACETLAVECDFSQIGSLQDYRALVNDHLA